MYIDTHLKIDTAHPTEVGKIIADAVLMSATPSKAVLESMSRAPSVIVEVETILIIGSWLMKTCSIATDAIAQA